MKPAASRYFSLGLLLLVAWFFFDQANLQYQIPPGMQFADSLSENSDQLPPELKGEESSATKPGSEPVGQVETKVYQWRDDHNRLQFGQTPPTDRPYKTLDIKTPKSDTRLAPGNAGNYPSNRSSQPQFYRPSDPSPPNNTSATDPTEDLSMRCQGKYHNVQRFEEKLAKADDVVGSIWLQDYCSALSEFIQDGCVLPKKQVTYNAYCAVRFKR